ncbi:MAG: hypothetical protein IJ762_05965 [Bacteroidaceae bacterium]|nr:hypothetical protein [Bacteroidaceae bacterium]
MTLRLTLISQEVEDFIQEFKIDADASFLDLHRLILQHCGYEELPGQRFFICDDNWYPTRRILLADEGDVDIDEDIYLMGDTDLREFLEDEGQRFAYRFDPVNRRMFLLELTETTFGDKVPETGLLTRRHGDVPPQLLQEEDAAPAPTASNVVSEELEEAFYGDDGFDEEDLDMEGFDILNQ